MAEVIRVPEDETFDAATAGDAAKALVLGDSDRHREIAEAAASICDRDAFGGEERRRAVWIAQPSQCDGLGAIVRFPYPTVVMIGRDGGVQRLEDSDDDPIDTIVLEAAFLRGGA